jgi:hypothetical protein
MQNCFSSFFCALNTKGYAKTQFKPRDIEEEEAIFFFFWIRGDVEQKLTEVLQFLGKVSLLYAIMMEY